jgi:hypothetical protein
VNSLDSSYPGVWSVNIRMGPVSGASNVFQIAAGGLTQTVTIVPNNNVGQALPPAKPIPAIGL